MAKYTIETTDDEDAGITAARDAYNAGRKEDDPEIKADNAAYVAFVMASAFESYRKQYKVA